MPAPPSVALDGEVEVFWEGPRRWYKATVTDIVRDVGRRWAVLVEYEDMSEAYHFFDDGRDSVKWRHVGGNGSRH
eukprot:scaffold12325_cov110-Isochrysis_galbana.AAC.1